MKSESKTLNDWLRQPVNCPQPSSTPPPSRTTAPQVNYVAQAGLLPGGQPSGASAVAMKLLSTEHLWDQARGTPLWRREQSTQERP